MKKLLFSTFCVLLSMLVIACGNNDKAPELAAEKFITSIYDGDTKTAISLTHVSKEMVEKVKNDPQSFPVEGKIKSMVEKCKEKADKFGGIASIKATESQYINDEKTQANVTVLVTYKNDNQTDNETVKLMQKDNQWYVIH